MTDSLIPGAARLSPEERIEARQYAEARQMMGSLTPASPVNHNFVCRALLEAERGYVLAYDHGGEMYYWCGDIWRPTAEHAVRFCRDTDAGREREYLERTRDDLNILILTTPDSR